MKKKDKFYEKYLDGKLKLKKYQWVGIVMLVVVITGFVGWVWEFILAEVAGGFQHLYIKGGNLLPWMNIYAYGALIIMLVSWKLKRYPWAVFVASSVACGILELFAGWIVYTVGNGTRYWDYSHAWWGWGNINGFVCPVSVAVFGLGALAFMYWLLPMIMRWSVKMTKRAFLTLAITLFTIVMVDDITNLTLKNLGLATAQDLYKALGWVYKS
ncbi:putative ABC transporter permease [Candidatus Saccharibacteria bacterium]|nr:putative ABC transporter permease [Candidatus Saccharibacteria bacterium]MBQ6375703.1 putative ABC transporter permease [Candidatus Saccharibacteria bacterium]